MRSRWSIPAPCASGPKATRSPCPMGERRSRPTSGPSSPRAAMCSARYSATLGPCRASRPAPEFAWRTPMQRKRVNSSKLRSVGYDEATRTLEVEMSNGQVYQYVGVYPEVYRRFMAAPNPTSFFDDKIAEEYTPKPVK